jgi:putative Mn2+ efflux pump MntP
MIEVVILAIALSMDAFAVSIGLGSKKYDSDKLALPLPILAGLYFGLLQGLMPLLGYLGGRGALSFIEGFANFIAFFLLLLIGAKMLFEAYSEGVAEEIAIISHRVMLTLAIATSIDALAAGFSLTLLNVNVYIASLIIATITFSFSWLGVKIGAKTSNWLESRAEVFGGLILIGLGFNFLLF